MYKIVHFLNYILLLSSSLMCASEAPLTHPLDRYFKRHQDEHKEIMRKEGDILEAYLQRINFLDTFKHVSADVRQEVNEVFHSCFLKEHIDLFKVNLKLATGVNEHLLAVLQNHAAALKKGMAALPQVHPAIASHFKVCADCLCRVVITHFPNHVLDWAHEIPLRIKNEAEKTEHEKSLTYTRNADTKGRMVHKSMDRMDDDSFNSFYRIFCLCGNKKPFISNGSISERSNVMDGI